MKATANKIPLASASTLSPVSDAAPGSNIDQLRDIIFGGQMREYEKRFVRMEERLAKEISEMREEVLHALLNHRIRQRVRMRHFPVDMRNSAMTDRSPMLFNEMNLSDTNHDSTLPASL